MSLIKMSSLKDKQVNKFASFFNGDMNINAYKASSQEDRIRKLSNMLSTCCINTYKA